MADTHLQRIILRHAHDHSLTNIDNLQRAWFAKLADVYLRSIYREVEISNRIRREMDKFNEATGMRACGGKYSDDEMQALWPIYDPDNVSSPATIIKIGEACEWSRD